MPLARNWNELCEEIVAIIEALPSPEVFEEDSPERHLIEGLRGAAEGWREGERRDLS